jgi:hypothetical protein
MLAEPRLSLLQSRDGRSACIHPHTNARISVRMLHVMIMHASVVQPPPSDRFVLGPSALLARLRRESLASGTQLGIVCPYRCVSPRAQRPTTAPRAALTAREQQAHGSVCPPRVNRATRVELSGRGQQRARDKGLKDVRTQHGSLKLCVAQRRQRELQPRRGACLSGFSSTTAEAGGYHGRQRSERDRTSAGQRGRTAKWGRSVSPAEKRIW